MNASLYALLDQGTLALTASRRLAHALSAGFAEYAQARGRSVWPTPQVLPWATFVRNAIREHRNGQAQAPRLLSDWQTAALWERIVAASTIGQQLLNPVQAARSAARSWQRLHEYRLSLPAIAAYPMEETQAFVTWARQFQQRTQHQGWLDGARVTAWLSASDYTPSQSVVLLGFDELTPDMEQLIACWRERGVSVERWPQALHATQVAVFAAADARAELDSAARWARQQLEQGAHRIGVVVPRLAQQLHDVERAFARVFNPAANRAGVLATPLAFTVAASAPLNSYPLIHHALLCLQLAQGRAATLLVGQLLRSPFLMGHEQEATQRALLDLKVREENREQWDAGEVSHVAAAQGCPQLAGAMTAVNHWLREQRDAALPSRWAERFSQLLQHFGWAQGRALDSTEQQTRVKFYEVLAELSVLDELLGRLSVEQAVTALRDACQTERFAPESSAQPVTIIDADTVAGMEFDALWVMGLHAGEWPPAIDPDPWLPIEVQRQHQLPQATAAQCLQAAQRTLERLVHSAAHVTLSWPRQEGDAELRMSPLLIAWPEVTHLPASSMPTLAAQLFQQRPTLERFDDHHAPPVTRSRVKGGAQIFELQARCAFRAQAQLRLHAEPLPNVTVAIEPMDRGILLHRVLTEVWQAFGDSQGLQRALTDVPALTTRVHGIAERIVQQLVPATTAHRQRLLALEAQLATQWVMTLLALEAQRPPFTVQRAEQRESFDFAGLTIAIQLDRIDALHDGSTLLIDYKTGDSYQPTQWLDVSYPGRPRSPQLPLYALAHRERLAGIAFAIVAPGHIELRGLASSAELQTVGVRDYESLRPNAKPLNADTWNDLVEHWGTVLHALGQQYLSGAAQVDPLPHECDYCHLAGLCRIDELNTRVAAGEEGGDD